MSKERVSQRALAVLTVGGESTLFSRPVPRPEAGDVLVQVEAVGINPGEFKIFDVWNIKDYPFMTGTDGAGTVVEVGQDVNGISVGDRVVFQGYFDHDRSSHQEYALVYADLLAKIPPSMTSLEASTIPLGLGTAALGLALPYDPVERSGAGLKAFWDDAEGFYRGQPIVILGGSSSVGQFVIQIAKYLGFSPIITTSSLPHRDYLLSLGASHVLDRHSDPAAHIQEIIGTAPLRIVYDAVHTPITQAEIDLLSPGGQLVSIWALPSGPSFDLSGDRRVIACYGNVHLYKDVGRAMYAKLGQFLERGIIQPNRVEKLAYGLAGVSGGLKRLQENRVSGVKLVIDPRETPD